MIDGKQDNIPTKYLKTTNIVHADGSRLKLGNLPGYTPAYVGNSIKIRVAFWKSFRWNTLCFMVRVGREAAIR